LHSRSSELVRKLDGRSIVLVGMMGSGKTSIGRRLAATLGLPFVDADVEIENAAGMTIPEIFARHGEAYFRDGERRVIARILADGQRVLATGGGAYINPVTRERIAERGVSIWLKADAEVLARRVRKRANRPLLHTRDPEQTLRELIELRYPVYALADFCLISREGPHESMVEAVMDTLERGLETLPRLQHAPKEPAMTTTPLVDDANAAHARTIVPVELGSRRYEIAIGEGLIAQAGALIGRIAPGAACAIVTDATVARHHLPALEASLESAGVRHARIVVAAGEASKCWATFARVCDEIIAGFDGAVVVLEREAESRFKLADRPAPRKDAFDVLDRVKDRLGNVRRPATIKFEVLKIQRVSPIVRDEFEDRRSRFTAVVVRVWSPITDDRLVMIPVE
jgi:shikimate kinase/3-dehydroquinate synthase